MIEYILEDINDLLFGRDYVVVHSQRYGCEEGWVTEGKKYKSDFCRERLKNALDFLNALPQD